MLHSATNKSFLQKRHAFIEYETKIIQSIYNKLKTYFPAEIRRIIWQLTIENHNSIYYNDIVISSDNPRDCEEILQLRSMIIQQNAHGHGKSLASNITYRKEKIS